MSTSRFENTSRTIQRMSRLANAEAEADANARSQSAAAQRTNYFTNRNDLQSKYNDPVEDGEDDGEAEYNTSTDPLTTQPLFGSRDHAPRSNPPTISLPRAPLTTSSSSNDANARAGAKKIDDVIAQDHLNTTASPYDYADQPYYSQQRTPSESHDPYYPEKKTELLPMRSATVSTSATDTGAISHLSPPLAGASPSIPMPMPYDEVERERTPRDDVSEDSEKYGAGYGSGDRTGFLAADGEKRGTNNSASRLSKYGPNKGSRSNTPTQDGNGFGNWQGPARGGSPYGPLGDASPNQQMGGTPSRTDPNLLRRHSEPPGDPAKKGTAFTRFILRLYASTGSSRWKYSYVLFITLLFWIPGIVGSTGTTKSAAVWGVPLIWWSIWLTVVWVGWFAAHLVVQLGPPILRNTVGIVAPELRYYILYMDATQFYAAAVGWAAAVWLSFLPLLTQHQNTTGTSSGTLSLFTQFLFGVFIVLVILLAEKLVIQMIAHSFHKKSYEDRIKLQKEQVSLLSAMYAGSHDIGRHDTLDGAYGAPARPGQKRRTTDPSLLVKKAFHRVKAVAKLGTTMIGSFAAEFRSDEVYAPDSPIAIVTTALGSSNKTKQLARRLYYSFVPTYRDSLMVEDIVRCFPDREKADEAFEVLDRDSNGDATLDEIEMSCLDIHRERLALSNSMRDIDSAVRRLDDIIMSLWSVISIIIIVGLLDASFQTMIAGAGTLILGLSWLIGTTAQEILASVIFLFVKHVYDVGDRVDIGGVSYIVLEMHLLSTIFKRTDGMIVQAPHIVLNQQFVNNIRRSGPIAETYTWNVNFLTPFEKIEELRERMLEFLEIERRDFLPSIVITVMDYVDQASLTLSAQISYRSNWQNGALKAQRRNKWICALKLSMANLSIYGPLNAGNPIPPLAIPVRYTEVPFSEQEEAQKAEAVAASEREKVNTRALVMKMATAKIPVGTKTAAIPRDESDFSDDEGSTVLRTSEKPSTVRRQFEQV